jgi:hypothetical protein
MPNTTKKHSHEREDKRERTKEKQSACISDREKSQTLNPNTYDSHTEEKKNNRHAQGM